MKNMFFWQLFCFIVCGAFCAQGAGEEGVLFQAVSESAGDRALGGVQGVERFRFVTVDLAQFGGYSSDGVFKPANKLTLNFFDDAVFEVELDRVEPGGSGGTTWLGHPAVPLSGTVAIVFNDKTASGTIVIGARRFQIRNDGGEVHAIRELVAKRENKRAVQMTSLEMDVYYLVNDERASQGLHLYAANETLGNSARGHSQDMAQNNYFSHTNLSGKTASQRITAAGYNWSACAENIAAGSATAAGTMEQWMNSSGHRANILSTAYCDLGVGYGYSSWSTYRYYWTQNFGKQLGVGTCPAVQTSWWSGATDLGGGWKYLDWFGYFTVSGNWIYHDEHGWLYVSATTTADMFIYDSALTSWWWTSQSVYPNLYVFINSRWYYYSRGTKNPRSVYNYATGQWEAF